MSSATEPSVGDSPTDYFGLGKPALAGGERFRNLTDLKWGDFEAMGFGNLNPAEKKLQFDLTESAQTVDCFFPNKRWVMLTLRPFFSTERQSEQH